MLVKHYLVFDCFNYLSMLCFLDPVLSIFKSLCGQKDNVETLF
jgi:hypothetical protein